MNAKQVTSFDGTHILGLLLDGVIASRVEWIAADNPPRSHDTAFDYSMFIDGLEAIVGAGWVEAAGVRRQSARECQLVEANKSEQQKARHVENCQRQIAQRWLRMIFLIEGVIHNSCQKPITGRVPIIA